jgi:hypothetical protein
VRSTQRRACRLSALIIPIRASIVGPPFVATTSVLRPGNTIGSSTVDPMTPRLPRYANRFGALYGTLPNHVRDRDLTGHVADVSNPTLMTRLRHGLARTQDNKINLQLI